MRGGLLAVGSAALFGLGTPLVQRAGQGVGPFATAALLYAGAAIAARAWQRPPAREAALRRVDGPRLVAMALCGAGLAPAALAWGLQHTDGARASLMLTLEALFTTLLARALYRETIDRRVAAAMGCLLAGSVVLVLGRAAPSAAGVAGAAGPAGVAGLLAVVAATVGWALDNTWSRALADRDPGAVVGAKSTLGATLTATIAAIAGESMPDASRAFALAVVGATGYGLSLRLYLLAQREFGAARTSSVFASAPFIGALAASAAAGRLPDAGIVAGGLVMAAGVVLHLVESHAHEHVHEALDHEHAHTHDDGHHDHAHDPMRTDPRSQPHSHPHRHAPHRHAHPHVPDAHHQHRH